MGLIHAAVQTHGMPERTALDDRDTTERLGADDMATLHEQQFLQAAVLGSQRAAAREPRSVPGVCTNCGEACLPSAVYCDDDCRSDHQHRVTVRARQVRRG